MAREGTWVASARVASPDAAAAAPRRARTSVYSAAAAAASPAVKAALPRAFSSSRHVIRRLLNLSEKGSNPNELLACNPLPMDVVRQARPAERRVMGSMLLTCRQHPQVVPISKARRLRAALSRNAQGAKDAMRCVGLRVKTRHPRPRERARRDCSVP